MNGTRTAGANWLMSLLCSLLMAIQPALGAPVSAPIGRVNGKGPIELNGVTAPAGADVYLGNRIATGPKASGNVTLAEGGKLVVGSSTSAEITKNSRGFLVRLDRGVVGAVSENRSPIVVSAGGVTIRPRLASGAYEVELNGNKLEVLARRGGALVEAANRTVAVAPGKLLKANLAPKTPSSKKKKALIAAITGVAVVGAGVGIALAYPSETCQTVSPSGFTCR